MARIFLSHSHPDKANVRRLAEALRRAGHAPWLDEEVILVGESIPVAVARGLQDTDYVVLCLSQAGIKSGWVEAEVSITVMRQFKQRQERLLPVRFDKVPPPGILAHLSYVDLFPGKADWARGTEKLLKSIASYEARRGAAGAASLSPPMPPNNLPPRREFVGRAADLSAVHEALGKEGKAEVDARRVHAEEALAAAGEVEDDLLWIGIADRIATHLQHRAEFASSLTIFQQALAKAETLDPPNPAQLATSLSNLALVLKALGEAPGARPLLERALGIDEKTFGPDHPTVARDLSNLALVLKDLREPVEAKRLLLRAQAPSSRGKLTAAHVGPCPVRRRCSQQEVPPITIGRQRDRPLMPMRAAGMRPACLRCSTRRPGSKAVLQSGGISSQDLHGTARGTFFLSFLPSPHLRCAHE